MMRSFSDTVETIRTKIEISQLRYQSSNDCNDDSRDSLLLHREGRGHITSGSYSSGLPDAPTHGSVLPVHVRWRLHGVVVQFCYL